MFTSSSRAPWEWREGGKLKEGAVGSPSAADNTLMGDLERLLARALASGTHTLPTPSTALSILSAGRLVLRTGVPALDRILRGGFPCRSVRYTKACLPGNAAGCNILLLQIRSHLSHWQRALRRGRLRQNSASAPGLLLLCALSHHHERRQPGTALMLAYSSMRVQRRRE